MSTSSGQALSQTLHSLVPRTATTLERRAGTLASELRWQAGRAGDAIVAFIARSGEIAPVLESLRGLIDDPNTKLRLVVPKDLAEAIQRKDWKLVKAADGSGFLPTVQDENGQWVRQVRLIEERLPPNPAEVANAMAHAHTHAMLHQVLEKLSVMDDKLDQITAQQRNVSVGKVISGIQIFKRIAAEPGDDASRVAQLANALQSLEEGQNTLLLDLGDRLKGETVKLRRWWEPSFSPSVMRAQLLDRHALDIHYLYGAARTIAAIHSMQDRPMAARDAVVFLSKSLEPVRERLNVLYEHARYSSPRGVFWGDTFPLLLGGFEPLGEGRGLAFETSPAELLALEKSKRD